MHANDVRGSLPLPPCHPVAFDHIDGSLIRTIVLQLDGAAGPSGLDSSARKQLCTFFLVSCVMLVGCYFMAALPWACGPCMSYSSVGMQIDCF